MWAGQWSGIGLLSATSLHLLCTLVSVPLSCRRACQHNESRQADLQDAKHHLVTSWLGRHNPPILTPHHLLVSWKCLFNVLCMFFLSYFLFLPISETFQTVTWMSGVEKCLITTYLLGSGNHKFRSWKKKKRYWENCG